MKGLILFLLGASCALAQSPFGTVTGIASDPAQAVVAGASVSLKNEATGIVYETKTNASGVYTFPNLAPGRYKLSAQSAGFRGVETQPFALAAYQTIREDLRLEVASASAEVTVSEPVATVIQVDTPSINPALSRQQILELPTNLRSVYNNSGDSGLTAQILPLTVPGVVQVGSGAAWLVPGSGANSVKLKVDGIETNFGNFGAPDPVSQPSVESVQEFTANIVTNKAEFGGQGTITTVTRSGGNEFHGDLFWYLRNSGLDARNPIVGKQFVNLHDYGLSGGGPILRDKTFFFATFEGIRGVRGYPLPPTAANVPTLAQRAGDFSTVAPLKNPFPGQTIYAGNKILPQFFSPQALKAQQQFFPLPNYGPADSFSGNYRATYNGEEVHHSFEIRLDHNFSSRHSAFARYQNKKDDYHIPGARSVLPPTSVGTSTNIRRVNFFSAGDLYSIRPNIFNEFRAGALVLVSQSDADLKGQQVLDQLGITGLPSRAGIKGIPNFSISGYSTVTESLLNPVNDGHAQVSDNLTWVLGRHTLKFGGEYINWFVNRYLTTNSGLFGNFSFTNRYTGNAYADFLLGLPTSVTRIDPYPTQYNRFYDAAAYTQDDFKLTAKLTLNYGLRYEFNSPVKANDGNLYSFDLKSGSILVPSQKSISQFSPYFPKTLPVMTADQLRLNSSLRHPYYGAIAPRFGFSYQVGNDGRTVVRGGWGIYYGHFSGLIASYLAAGPYSFATTATNPASGPVFTLANPFSTSGAAGTVTLSAVSPDLKPARAMQFSITIERQIARDLGVRVSYIGNAGRQLPYQRNVNQPLPSSTPFAQSRRPYPLFGNILYGDNGANSSYNSLQTQVQKRFSKGLLLSSAWTWAKELSEVDDTDNAELNTTIENAYDRRRDRGNVYAVPRHQWQNQALYELPFGKGKVLGGWQVNMLLNVQTGNYLNPQFSGPDTSNTNTTTARPDVANSINYPKTLAQWYDRTSFSIPPNGRFGNAARNLIEGPGWFLMNLGLAKSIHFEKIGTLQLAASFQNVLNHFNWGQPSTSVNTASGGAITSTAIFPPAGSPRTGQVNLRWTF